MFIKIKQIILPSLLMAFGGVFAFSGVVTAQEVEQDDCQAGFVVNAAATGCVEANTQSDPNGCASQGLASDAIQACLEEARNPDGEDTLDTTFDPTPGTLKLDQTVDNKNINKNENPIYKWLISVVNFLSIGVGIVVTLSVAIAGVQYTVSRGDPNKTAAAVNRIVQAGLAIVLYVFGWALLNWLIPGGVINS